MKYALAQFLNFCHQQNIRCARIIHGKGWGSRDNKPILKSKLNVWLRQRPIVLAFCSATVEDGGTGALYGFTETASSGSHPLEGFTTGFVVEQFCGLFIIKAMKYLIQIKNAQALFV